MIRFIQRTRQVSAEKNSTEKTIETVVQTIVSRFIVIIIQRSFLSLMVVLALARTGECGMCMLRPFEEEVCESPLVFRGRVENVEHSVNGDDWRSLTNTYTIRILDIYRAVGVLNLETGDLVKIVAPNQMISTAVYMEKRNEYFIRGTLTEEDGNKLVDSDFCQNRRFSFLKSEDVNKLRSIQCDDDK